MVPPFHRKLPVPVKLPGPVNPAPPVSSTAVPAPIDRLLARVICAPWSNSAVPPPLMWTPGLNSPGPTVTRSVLPAPTDTGPWSSKFIQSRWALPDPEAGTVSVPVLRNSSGDTQHALAPTAAPGFSVNAPEELMFAAKASSGPEPWTVVGPWKASRAGVLPGDIRIFLAVPLTVVWMVLATLRLPSMVPPVHENAPPPVKLPGPKNSAF